MNPINELMNPKISHIHRKYLTSVLQDKVDITAGNPNNIKNIKIILTYFLNTTLPLLCALLLRQRKQLQTKSR